MKHIKIAIAALITFVASAVGIGWGAGTASAYYCDEYFLSTTQYGVRCIGFVGDYRSRMKCTNNYGDWATVSGPLRNGGAYSWSYCPIMNGHQTYHYSHWFNLYPR